MTGFGRATAALDGGRIVAEVRTVNHKHQNIHVSCGYELPGVEEKARKLLSQRFSRGRVDASLRVEGHVGSTIRLNEEVAESCFVALDKLRKKLGLDTQVPLQMLAHIQDVFTIESAEVDAKGKDAAVQALRHACEAVVAMREAEGENLARDFAERLERVEQSLEPARVLGEQTAPAYLEKLRGRMTKLLSSMGQALDEQRLVHEAALIAERADVTEELIRLKSHVAQFRKIASERGPVGRRLEFLLQEMSREANTVGAKAQDPALQHMVVDLRGELARMTEQVHNVE